MKSEANGKSYYQLIDETGLFAVKIKGYR